MRRIRQAESSPRLLESPLNIDCAVAQVLKSGGEQLPHRYSLLGRFLHVAATVNPRALPWWCAAPSRRNGRCSPRGWCAPRKSTAHRPPGARRARSRATSALDRVDLQPTCPDPRGTLWTPSGAPAITSNEHATGSGAHRRRGNRPPTTDHRPGCPHRLPPPQSRHLRLRGRARHQQDRSRRPVHRRRHFGHPMKQRAKEASPPARLQLPPSAKASRRSNIVSIHKPPVQEVLSPRERGWSPAVRARGFLTEVVPARAGVVRSRSRSAPKHRSCPCASGGGPTDEGLGDVGTRLSPGEREWSPTPEATAVVSAPRGRGDGPSPLDGVTVICPCSPRERGGPRLNLLTCLSSWCSPRERGWSRAERAGLIEHEALPRKVVGSCERSRPVMDEIGRVSSGQPKSCG
ncbi:hypothetical protein SAMN05421835_101789 [Amycolatopsis sacchari]|uniref:Uncharacterized protein n=1 Tax=Amycolatopsis sacchari TaxID=115433 RepID=A0A1I3L284_9PSEU|nr:hypothetical protein SAMN05421835_101789 [Amycolatopsis sacchari]